MATVDRGVNRSLQRHAYTDAPRSRDEATRDRWVAETAKQTVDRVGHFHDATDEYVELAKQEYDDPDVETYLQTAIDALEELEADEEPVEATPA